MSKTSKSQPTESSSISSTKDDGSINFRPSPNFKHMKKYLKSKFEEDMNTMEKESKAEVLNKVATVVQPPLPPNSPPPDSPLGIVKQEVEDKEYEQTTEESLEETIQLQSLQQSMERKKPDMCKDFVRKTCTRGAACIYSHEINFSQLKGVYKFCRDFENGCCNRPVCNFVHVTTWEKEHFFRSAYLPPHAFAHMKPNVVHPQNETPKEIPPMFKVPVPPPPLPGVPPAPMGPPHGAVLAPRPAAPPAPLPPPLKTEYQPRYSFPIDTVASPPRELEAKDPIIRKCNRCELTELRLQHSKAQMAQAMKSSRDMDEKLEQIMKKNKRLHSVLRVLLKQRRIQEHVNSNFLSSSRLQSVPRTDDATKEALYAQMEVLLSKFLVAGDGSLEGGSKGS